MYIKIGDVNIGGPGWRVQQQSQRPDFDMGGRDSSCVSCGDNPLEEELTFQLYALGGCDIEDIYTRRIAALQAELDTANCSDGHLVYLQKIDTWEYRRELYKGVIEPNQFELRYRRRPKLAYLLKVRIRNTRILTPVTAKASQSGWASDVYKAALVMSNTTAATGYLSATNVGDLVTLDRFNGSGYADFTILNRTREDGVLYSSDLSWVNLGNGTRQIAGILIYKFVTNDANSPIVTYIPSSNWGSNFDPDGNTVKFYVNARGLMREP